MNKAKTPRSLRSSAAVNSVSEKFDNQFRRKVTAVAGLMAVASFSGAEAQQSNLPPVTVDAPVTRPRPTASKPTPDQVRARNALRRAARRSQPTPGRAGAVSERRNPERGPQSLCGCGRALQGRSSAGVGQIPRAAAEHAEDRHGAQQGSAGRRERHVVEAGGAQHRRRDARNRRGRQRLRRPLLRSRLRYPQRRLHRRRPRLPASASARISSPSRSRSCAVPARRSPAAAPPAARSTSSPSRRRPKKASTIWTTTIATDPSERVTLDVNQVISPTLAVRAGGVFQECRRRRPQLRHRRSRRRLRGRRPGSRSMP